MNISLDDSMIDDDIDSNTKVKVLFNTSNENRVATNIIMEE